MNVYYWDCLVPYIPLYHNDTCVWISGASNMDKPSLGFKDVIIHSEHFQRVLQILSLCNWNVKFSTD